MASANYYKATNLAYEVLLNSEQDFLPIDLFQMISRLPKNIKVLTYSSLMKKYDLSYEDLIEIAPSVKGFFSYKVNNDSFLIFYNDFLDMDSIRFTLAHELGHFFLGHKEDTKENDKEANCFARNLLSPYPVIEKAELTTLEGISRCCQISLSAAIVRVDRFRSDCHWISSEYYNAICSKFDYASLYMLYE